MPRLTLPQMAARLGRCSKTLRKYVKAYSVPHIRLGRAMLFDPARVEMYLESINLDEKRRKPEYQSTRRAGREVNKYDARLGI